MKLDLQPGKCDSANEKSKPESKHSSRFFLFVSGFLDLGAFTLWILHRRGFLLRGPSRICPSTKSDPSPLLEILTVRSTEVHTET